MSQSINKEIDFLKNCKVHHQAVQRHREQLMAQHMGHMDRVLASKEAYRQYQYTGNPAEINRLKNLGIWVDTTL